MWNLGRVRSEGVMEMFPVYPADDREIMGSGSTRRPWQHQEKAGHVLVL